MAKTKKTRLVSPIQGLGLPELPDINEIREQAEKLVGSLSEAKEIPKVLKDHFLEADADFREADKAFKGIRISRK